MTQKRDHGGGLDGAIEQFGGERADWIDLSTGINPTPYPVPDIPIGSWTDLPDTAAQTALLTAARRFWGVPHGAGICAASGVSAIIAALPRLGRGNAVGIKKPTYNEHEAAFVGHGYTVRSSADCNVYVHPNNPDGRLFSRDYVLANHGGLTIIDESFCDTCPSETLMELADQDGIVVLKGLGKFWGLAGLRLGFAMARPETIERLNSWLGPWAVSGPAQFVGAKALADLDWALNMRAKLAQDASQVDKILSQSGAKSVGGTALFRLFEVENAQKLQLQLAQHQIWTRIFPYSERLIRFGLLRDETGFARLAKALES